MALDFIHGAVQRDSGSRFKLLTKPQPLWKKEAPHRKTQGQTVTSEVVVRGPGLRYPTDVTFLQPHMFLVADSEAHHVTMYDMTRDDPEIAVLRNGRVWPNCIATTPDGKHVGVTDRKSNMVKVFDVERGVLVLGIEKPWEDFGEIEIPWHPHGIAFNSKGEIIVTDTGEKHAVHIFHKNGELKKSFGSKGRVTLQHLCLPFYCAVDSSDNIVVSDNLNYCVKIFDPEGNFKSQIGSGKLWGQKHFECPYGVCVDPNDNILVADNATHRVILNRSGGEMVKEIMTRMNGCRYPAGVAVGKCGTLAFTEAGLNTPCGVKAYHMYDPA